jgi:hypothetical protein
LIAMNRVMNRAITQGQATGNTWHADNWQYFMGAIAQFQSALQLFVGQEDTLEQAFQTMADWLSPFEATDFNPQPRLIQLCQLFGLSPLERNILLLCAGVEMHGALASLCAELHGNPQQPHVTFQLILSIFQAQHWEAFHPDAPLRRWRLVEIGGGNTFANSPVRIDERILHDLLGGHHIDHRLEGIMSAYSTMQPELQFLPESHRQLVARVVHTALGLPGERYVVQICGWDAASKLAIATAACAEAGLGMRIIAVDALPTDLEAFNQVRCLCEREALLSNSALILDCDRLTERNSEGNVGAVPLNGAIARWINTLTCPVILLSRERRQSDRRPLITLEVDSLSADEQRAIWYQVMGDRRTVPNPTSKTSQKKNSKGNQNNQTQAIDHHIDNLVTYFNLNGPAIRSAWTGAISTIDPPNGKDDTQALSNALWNACLTQSRPKLDDLAQFIEARASWADLVLPEKEQSLLQTIAAHVRQRALVYEKWGFAKKSRRGLGISTLFAGSSGTGKTMAAEVLAKELNLNLYKIDLSSVVSKYIGETEKNLRRIFDAAETGGAILLFDEADSLFGKRSDVKDSHDRYANMEVSYLLQRIESYRGLAILTTNLKTSMDQAFLRRLRFVIQFPFPEANQRAEIWRRIFPAETPTKDLAYDKLGNLQVAGGNIRNIALNAAFLAADAGEPIQMQHILQSAQNEYIKLERSLTEQETKGWIRKETQPFVPQTGT